MNTRTRDRNRPQTAELPSAGGSADILAAARAVQEHVDGLIDDSVSGDSERFNQAVSQRSGE